MSIATFLHNSTEALLSEFNTALKSVKRHPLKPLYVVVQSTGLKEWLKLQLAKNHGIAANIQFITPNYLPYLSCKAMGVKYASGKKAEELLWGIHQVLQSDDFIDAFPEVAQYYSENRYKQMQLAVKLADLFDQYSLYRSEEMQAWSQNKKAERYQNHENIEAWQKYIWFQLSPDNGPVDLFDSSLSNTDVLLRLQKNDVSQDIKAFFPSLLCFAISALSPYHSQLLTGLSQHTNVNLFMLNPSPEAFWYDIRKVNDKLRGKKLDDLVDEDFEEEGNEFLLAQGRLLKSLMHQLSDADTEFFNHYEAASITKNVSLLQNLQTEIVENKAPQYHHQDANNLPDYSTFFTLNKALKEDKSLQVHSHYSIYREVQGLYDFLLDQQQKLGNLKGDEIAVLTPSLAKYAPFVKAVFDNAPHRIPYNLAGLSDADEHSPVAFIFELLNLSENEFTAEKALALLEYPDVARHYDIHDKVFIRLALKQANIKWKISHEKNASELHQITWQYGLQRLACGLLTNSEENILLGEDDYLHPVQLASPNQYSELLRFIHFVDELIAVIQKDGKMRGIKNCGDYVLQLIVDFLPDHGIEEKANVDELIKVIANFNAQDTEEGRSIDLKSYIYAVQHQYREEENKRRVFNGAVIFANPKDVRAIPFRVVAYLGMDAATFPKQNEKSSFDLMQLKPKFGDRNFKDNDRHLFIESFMCASDAFYVSYIGKSAKTDTDLPASVVVDELIKFVNNRNKEAGIEAFSAKQHPLHHNSKRYAIGENGLFTYKQIKNAETLSPPELLEPTIEKKLAEVSDLIAYFKNAPKWYFQNVYNVSFYENDLQIEDAILIEPDGLQKHGIKSEVLEGLFRRDLEEETTLHLRQKLQSKGTAPLGEFARQVVDDYHQYFVDKLNAFNALELYRFENIKSLTLTGKIHGQVNYFQAEGSKDLTVMLINDSSKASEGKYKLELFVNSCLLASELKQEVRMLGIFKDNAYNSILSPEAAESALNYLMEIFEKRYDAINFFHADEMFELCVKSNLKKLFNDTFELDTYENRGLLDKDPYFRLLYNEGYAFNADAVTDNEVDLDSPIAKCWFSEGTGIVNRINEHLKKPKK